MNINKFTVYGNLTKDPELVDLPDGKFACNLCVATNRRSDEDITGIKVTTDYHYIAVYGTPAERVYKYRRKGDPVYVEGRVEGRIDSKKKYTRQNVATSIQWPVRTQEYDS